MNMFRYTSTAAVSMQRNLNTIRRHNSYYVLQYDYVENMIEKRGPVRPKHLEYAKIAQEKGELLFGGAFEPATNGLLIFQSKDDGKNVEAFAKGDPYVTTKLVTNYNIKKWNVVVGSLLNKQ